MDNEVMSLKVAVTFDPKPIVDGLNYVNDKVKGRATHKAVKQTMSIVKKETIKLIRGEYNYKTADLKDRIEINFFGEGINTSGRLESNTRPRGLASFLKGTPLINSRISQSPIKYQIKKAEGTQIAGSGAFLAQGKNGNWQVFRKVGTVKTFKTNDTGFGGTTTTKRKLKAMSVYSVATAIDYTPRINKLSDLAGKEFVTNFNKNCDEFFQKSYK